MNPHCREILDLVTLIAPPTLTDAEDQLALIRSAIGRTDGPRKSTINSTELRIAREANLKRARELLKAPSAAIASASQRVPTSQPAHGSSAARELAAALAKCGLAPKSLAQAREVFHLAKALLDEVSSSTAAPSLTRKPFVPAPNKQPAAARRAELWKGLQSLPPGAQRREFANKHRSDLELAAREHTQSTKPWSARSDQERWDHYEKLKLSDPSAAAKFHNDYLRRPRG